MKEIKGIEDVFKEVGITIPKEKKHPRRNFSPIAEKTRYLVSFDRKNGNKDMGFGGIVSSEIDITDRFDWKVQEEQVRDGLSSGETE